MEANAESLERVEVCNLPNCRLKPQQGGEEKEEIPPSIYTLEWFYLFFAEHRKQRLSDY